VSAPAPRRGRRVAVDAEDRALRPDERGGEQGDVAEATAEVEDAHPRRDARVAEEAASQRGEALGLGEEPSLLDGGAGDDIRGGGSRRVAHGAASSLWRCRGGWRPRQAAE
jgi:hypothetical protein